MSTGKQRATAADVARRAGVSRATVSYVLNGSETQSISPRTERAVRRAAAELDYRPNPFAQSLKRGRGGTVLFPLPGSGTALVLAEAVDACAAAMADCGLTLVTDSTRYRSPAERADAWMRLHPAAVIDIFLSQDEAAVEPLRNANIPLLTSMAGAPHDQSAADWLSAQARRTQIDYVLERGYRRILLAGAGAPDRRVERGFRRLAQEAAAAVGASIDIHRSALTHAGVAAVAEGWAAASARPDAICASHDDFAIALLGAFSARGIRVPDDVAVIGVDDVPLAAATTPPLTTVAGDLAAWGREIAQLMLDVLDGQADIVPLPVLRTRVVVRASA